ncbi:amino-acid N-acetyltransferase [Kineosphaera limosa]|uniref:amino-acid N-acetyltransferase n=1 Tax=Kineosphaera limosa TaxID=111564 RepID=UPI00031ECDC4|nr:amino-acid N-acetyltransferase [Kineosphaera limosa]NYE01288.1 amino-acid N-acetyltransferase [Kineosphaera limosa]
MSDDSISATESPLGGTEFVRALRSAAPYVHGHHGKTFVIAFPGEICLRADTDRLLADIALLCRLGVRVVLVHGARPQIEAELAVRGIPSRFEGDLRITDVPSMHAVKAAVGVLRMDIEARLSCSLANTPMAGSRIKVAGGNWVTARPVGVRGGVDHLQTGLVRGVDIAEIRAQLSDERIVLVSPVGYSPTGEAFNLRNADVAEAVATGLGADKLIFVIESEPGTWRMALQAGDAGQLSLTAAEGVLDTELRERNLSPEDRNCVRAGLAAVRAGVRRVHLIGTDGASPLLRELYSRDGCGLMIAADDDYESTRIATIDDVAGIMALIAPMEQAGTLVPRSREQLELDIAAFTVLVRDGTVIACNALVEFPQHGAAELACVAVHPHYRGRDLAAVLLRRARARARDLGYTRLIALTTQTPHWFIEHGFVRGSAADLPPERRATYDPGRNSLVLIDTL